MSITEDELKEIEARAAIPYWLDPDDDVTEGLVELDHTRLIAEVRRLRKELANSPRQNSICLDCGGSRWW